MKEIENPECLHCNARYKSIFCKLSKDDVILLNDKKECGQYKKGDVIFEEGHNAHGIYCMNNGKVKISQLGDEGKEQILNLAKDGDILGYRSVLTNEPYSVTATAIEDSSVCHIPKSLFYGMIEKNSNLAMEIIKILSDDIKIAEKNITDIAQKPVKERIAEALLFIRETYGFKDDSETLNVNLTREEIANIVGTATETTIRVLSEMKKHSILDLKGRSIKILNANELIKIANVSDYHYN